MQCLRGGGLVMFPEVLSKPRAALETASGVHARSPDSATWVLYTLCYPLDAVSLLCLFDIL